MTTRHAHANSTGFAVALRRRVRLWLHGRSVIDEMLTESGLPGEVRALLREVIRRTRLRPHEKLDVTRELIAHFHDGLQQHQTTEQIMQDFGDPKQAATLIRRAKVRNRSLTARVVMVIAPLLALGAGLYVLTAAHGEMVDYLSPLNEPARSLPEKDRAWPIYRAALIKYQFVGNSPSEIYTEGDTRRQAMVSPDDPRWPQAKAWLDAHCDLLDAFRAGGEKPGLGLTFGLRDHMKGDDLLALAGPDFEWGQPTSLWDETMIGILLPHLGMMRHMARVVVVDMRAALEDDDPERYLADVQALAGMARQSREFEVIISELVARSIMATMVREVGYTLEHDPDALSSAEWAQISAIASSLDDLNTPSFKGEQALIEDVLQRFYGPDGKLTEAAKESLLDANYQITDEEPLTPERIDRIAPLPEVHEAYERFWSLIEVDAQRCVGALYREGSKANQFLDSLDPDRMYLLRFTAYGNASALRTTGANYAVRQALLVAIAVERHRMDTGAYPPSTDALVPKYLPQLPRDGSVNEGTTLLKITDAGPIVYGRGLDTDDDGGLPFDDFSWPSLGGACGDDEKPIADGDWMLYPIPE